jgi:RimJ/RimL family protein N-acetyltransferase
VFDLSDLAVGSPLLDIRVAEHSRGQGVGTAAVRWLTTHLFETYPGLMRVEATTRHDNTAMQKVFDRCGYRQEGHLVEAWVSIDGSRSDTLIYAILRREWQHATHR